MRNTESRDRDILKSFFVGDNLTECIKHGHRFVFAGSPSEGRNPFLLKTYDFDEKFYQGEFNFTDPLTGFSGTGTPEEYGRRRLIANLCRADLHDKAVLDLGAGTLNIYRQLPSYIRKLYLRFINCDISGPWSAQGESSMELGAKRAFNIDADNVVNVQYDFNSLNWPFQEGVFDYVVSCMAIHHVRFENKALVLESIFRSLKPRGRLAVVDFFLKQEDGAKFTEAGKRGPEECGGCGQSFSEFLSVCKKIGFSIDEFCDNILLNKAFLTDDQIRAAISDVSKTLQINKAIWFTILSKGK